MASPIDQALKRAVTAARFTTLMERATETERRALEGHCLAGDGESCKELLALLVKKYGPLLP